MQAQWENIMFTKIPKQHRTHLKLSGTGTLKIVQRVQKQTQNNGDRSTYELVQAETSYELRFPTPRNLKLICLGKLRHAEA